MGTLVFFLFLGGSAPPAGCKPQLAPLQTGTSSGTSTLDFWRETEAGDWGGPGWLGWAPGIGTLTGSLQSDQLQPVELIVRDRPNDFLSDDKYVTVQAAPEVTFAVRCIPQLKAGPIQTIALANGSLQYEGPFLFTFGSRQYGIYLQSARYDLADAQVILTDGQRRQVLYSADGFVDDPHFDIAWAGDLDRDGQLDLIVNLHRKYSWHPYRLLLSSSASREQLVDDAAIFETGD
jgi:hypothetical protein